MAQRDWSFGGPKRRFAGSIESLQNVESCELRKTTGEWLREVHFPLFHQLKCGDGGDGLGHGGNLEYAVNAEGGTGGIPLAERARVESLVFASDHPHRGRNLAAANSGSERFIHPG